MTKYIVSGYIGFDNFGDEAIAMVLTNELKSKNAEKITFISSNPEKTAQNYDVNSCSMFKFLKPLAEADVLISGGGSLLQDITSLKSLIYYLGVIYIALLLRKKVHIFSQGIGPINTKIGRILTKYALSYCEKITVRDKKSQELLKSWNIASELVQDPVFNLDIIPKNLKGVVGVQLRSYSTLKDDFLRHLSKEIVLRFGNKQIQVISLQDSLDLEVCNQFANMLRKQGADNVQVLSKLSVHRAFEAISNLEYLIGMRFHANVAAIKYNVKTLAINYDPKVQKLAEEFNLPVINLDQSDFTQEFEQLVSTT